MLYTNIPVNITDEFAALTEHTIDLSEESIHWATQICQDVADTEEQWRVLLRAFAIAGFDQWLNDRAIPLDATYSRKTPPANGMNVIAGAYQICILAIGGLFESHIEIPISRTPANVPHLYILVEVQEEVNRVVIVAGLRHDQLTQWHHLATGASVEKALVEQPEQSIQIPIAEFNVAPEQLLLYLSCLEPDIAVANVTQNSQTKAFSAAVSSAVSSEIIKAGQWLQDQLDDISAELSWMLLPPRATASAMRYENAVERMMETLAAQGVSIPPQARGVSGSVAIGDQLSCQITVWAWAEDTLNVPEWSLLVLLGAQKNEVLPIGIILEMSDEREVLTTEMLTQTSPAYLYTQVQGEQTETFQVRIVLPTGEDAVLPNFGFH